MKNAASIVVAGLLAALIGTSALAQSKSREEVRAEAASAAKAGQIDHGEVTTTPPHPKASKTRAEVKAEAASAIKGGTLAHTDDGAPKAPAAPAAKSKPKADDAAPKS